MSSISVPLASSSNTILVGLLFSLKRFTVLINVNWHIWMEQIELIFEFLFVAILFGYLQLLLELVLQ